MKKEIYLTQEGLDLYDELLKRYIRSHGTSWDSRGNWCMFNPEYKPYKLIFYITTDNEKIDNSVTKKYTNVHDDMNEKICLVSKRFITKIDDELFLDARNLEAVEIPFLVKEIGKNSFKNCSALLYVEVPERVEKVSEYAFFDVPNVMYSGNLETEHWGAKSINGYIDGLLVFDSEEEIELRACSSVASSAITIPDTVEIIKSRAFSYCTDITGLYVPKSVTSIGEDAFIVCNKLYEIYYDGTIDEWNQIEKEQYWFLGSSIDYVHCIDGSIYLYEHATEIYFEDETRYRTFDTTLSRDNISRYMPNAIKCEVGDIVETIYAGAFSDFRKTNILDYKSTVDDWNEINKVGCWYENSSIDTVNCTDGIVDLYEVYGTKLYLDNGEVVRYLVNNIMREQITDYTGSLVYCTIGDFVYRIGDGAFESCGNMTALTLSDNILELGHSIIRDCYNLESFSYDGNISEWRRINKASDWFTGTNLEYIHCNDGDVDLCTVWYYNDGSEYAYTNRERVEEIYNGQFDKSYLVRCDIGEAAHVIGEQAFAGCDSLSTLVIPNTITQLNDYVFQECYNLSAITYNGLIREWDAFEKTNNWNSNSYLEVLYCEDGDIEATKLYMPWGITKLLASTITDEMVKNTDYQNIYKAEVGNGVKSIGYQAFYDCTSLTAVTTPESIEEIEELAFCNCTSLISIQLSNNLTKISGGLFSGCIGLSDITLPSGIRNIGYQAFSGCIGLRQLTLNEGLKTIENNAFQESGLESISIPSTTVNIAKNAFLMCANLEHITVDSGNIKYDSREDCNALIETESNILIFGTINSVIPNGVVEIYEYAFAYKNIEEIIIPGSVSYIGMSAFGYCSSLSSLIIENGADTIGEGAFSACVGLTDVTLPNSIKEIRNFAFKDDTSLTEITFNGTIDEWNNISKASDWNNGAMIETIHCLDGDIHIDIPVTKLYLNDGRIIKINAEEIRQEHIEPYKYSLVRCEMDSSVRRIDYGAFRGCVGIEEVNISDGVYYIGNNAFMDCESLISIVIPSSVPHIPEQLFSGCIGLESVEIEGGINEILFGAFGRCKSLTGITIPQSVTNIDSSAFSGCVGLTSIEIPHSVTRIGMGSFMECKSLANIRIGSGITYISHYAFYYCPNVQTITVEAITPPTAEDEYIFGDMPSDIPIYVPSESIDLYRSSLGWNYFSNYLPLE